MDPVLASSCALSAVTRASTLDFQASKMRAYDGPWQDMQETALARWVCGPSGPAEATSALNAGLWQPWQVTPAANIGLGLPGTLLRRGAVAVAGAAVTRRIVGRGRGPARQPPVLDRQVAVLAVHLVLRHVLVVQEPGVVVAREPRRLVVAGEAALLRPRAVAAHAPAVAEVALHVEARHLAVVERHALVARHLLRHLVALEAGSGPAVQGLRHEMAERARGRGHRDVAALDDLRVARRAPQSQAPAALGEMRGVIEDDVVEHPLALEQPPLVAAHAGRVVHLGPRLRARGAGEVLRARSRG